MALTADQVLALSPDAASTAAAKKLANTRSWQNLGTDDRALWGECQGSALYQVRVDLGDLAAKCSCPSRKFPCKHSLALLLLSAASAQEFARADAPEWVTSWLTSRGETAARREKKIKSSEPADPEAQAKRQQRRHERVLEGLDALDLWMRDLVRNGIASVEGAGWNFWESQAARLVDAQATALASRVRRLSYLAGSTPDWPERLLGELGRMALLTHAYRNIDRLPAPLQWDVRQLIGWTTPQDEVLSAGEKLLDQWTVLGCRTDGDERIRVQRCWLLGRNSRRFALILQFAPGSSPFPELIAPGTCIEAELGFWPSAYPLRALIVERRGQHSAECPEEGAGIGDLLDEWAAALERQPWTERIPAVLQAVVPSASSSKWRLVDAAGRSIELGRGEHWALLSVSAGRPVTVSGEWDGYELRPLAVFDGPRFVQLARDES